MKVKNLADFPQQLGDGRVIGAAGTEEDTREYDLKAVAEKDKSRAPGLTKEDKKRVKDGTLVVVEEVESKPTKPEKDEKMLSEGEVALDSSDKEKLPLMNAENNEGGTKGKQSGGKK